ncbi:hypothetical protein AAA799B03_01153 [Marine Group I thaumarchaeote SCGC AAA799-B03]|uniref:Uncharacterized protein n=1 Tax=Marine Group I thaumarchaeote SCGC AAA799-B03 TaxID=1502289 RepID=A0A087S6D7_9ARCH|nr:hypothetical protein AAA799B03_01153 [Marine Group I thaumarchaeote SCGC AAA799-B03]
MSKNIFSVIGLIFAIILLSPNVAVFGYDPDDPSFQQPNPNVPPHPDTPVGKNLVHHEQESIKNTIDFLREKGFHAEADNIQKYLDQGKIEVVKKGDWVGPDSDDFFVNPDDPSEDLDGLNTEHGGSVFINKELLKNFPRKPYGPSDVDKIVKFKSS